jgi:hypothetical protein
MAEPSRRREIEKAEADYRGLVRRAFEMNAEASPLPGVAAKLVRQIAVAATQFPGDREAAILMDEVGKYQAERRRNAFTGEPLPESE